MRTRLLRRTKSPRAARMLTGNVQSDGGTGILGLAPNSAMIMAPEVACHPPRSRYCPLSRNANGARGSTALTFTMYPRSRQYTKNTRSSRVPCSSGEMRSTAPGVMSLSRRHGFPSPPTRTSTVDRSAIRCSHSRHAPRLLLLLIVWSPLSWRPLGARVRGGSGLPGDRRRRRPLVRARLNRGTQAWRRAGLPHIRFHDLRHTAATLLLLQGIHPKVVSEMLGHSQVGITLNRYSHVLPNMQRDATAAMDRLLES
jgi:hypothetical protein